VKRKALKGMDLKKGVQRKKTRDIRDKSMETNLFCAKEIGKLSKNGSSDV